MLKGGEAAALSRISGDGRGWSGVGQALGTSRRAFGRRVTRARVRGRRAQGHVAAFSFLGALTIGVFAASLSGGHGPFSPSPIRDWSTTPPSAELATWAPLLGPTAISPLEKSHFALVEPADPTWLGVAISPSAAPVDVSEKSRLSRAVVSFQLQAIELPSASDLAHSVRTWLATAERDDGFLIPAFADAMRHSALTEGANDLVTVFEVEEDGAPHVKLASAEALALYFDRLDFNLESIRSGDGLVPRRYLASLPPDLDELASPGDRKQLFIKALLPVVLRVNEEIMADRALLAELRRGLKAGAALSFTDSVWLYEQLVRYDVGDDDLAELARRMDIIPPSLALAQAAEESGWGTSRFAREGNALFGQYTGATGRGLAPLSQLSEVRYRIQSYDSLVETVRSYALNLNLHPAYREFRDMRADLRGKGQPLNGYLLAGELKRYSERGKAYVRTLRVIMRDNDLRQFDGVRLLEPIIGYGQFGFDLPSS